MKLAIRLITFWYRLCHSAIDFVIWQQTLSFGKIFFASIPAVFAQRQPRTQALELPRRRVTRAWKLWMMNGVKWRTSQSQNTTQKSISIAFCVSSIRHDSSLSKYRKQKQSPPWTYAIFSISRGVTASVYGTC